MLHKIEANEAELASQVYVKDDCIVINVSYEYPIELSRCDSHAKILEWVTHLCAKNWTTPPVLERFIHVAAQTHGLNVHLSA